MGRLIWLEEEWSKFAGRGRKRRGGGERESGRGNRRVGGGVELAWSESGRGGLGEVVEIQGAEPTVLNCFGFKFTQYDRMIPRQGCK